MLSDVDLCRALRRSVGTGTYLVVATLANAAAIRRSTSIPTAALAAKRFEIGVLASDVSWIEGGRLSDTDVAMLIHDLPQDLCTQIRDSVKRFNFADPYSGAGLVELHTAVVELDLAGLPSVRETFLAAGRRLEVESREFPLEWAYRSRADQWCSDE